MQVNGSGGPRPWNPTIESAAAATTRAEARVDGYARGGRRHAHQVAGMRRNHDGSVTTPGGYRISRGEDGSFSITEPGGRQHTVGAGGFNPSSASSIVLGDGTKVSFTPGESTLSVQHGKALASIDLSGASATHLRLGGKAFDANNSDGALYVLAVGHRLLDGETLGAADASGHVNHDSAGFISVAAQKTLTDSFENEPILHYQGFMVDVSELDQDPNRAENIAHIEKQLDTVLAEGLPESVVDFMRTIPMTVHNGEDPTLPGTPAEYRFQTPERSGEVLLKPAKMNDDEPVLLHELLHAYHDQQLPNGLENATVDAAYQQAKSIYPAGSYMLKNHAEFFAMTASAYINGNIDRPPYTRDAVIANQPEYAKFLAALFGEL